MWASFTVFFVLASVGLPGLNGFVGEFLTLLGAFTSPSNVLGVEYAAFAGVGMILAAIYLLYMVGKVIFGPVLVPEVHTDDGGHELKDLNKREILTLVPLAAGCVVLGMLPHGVLKTLEDPVANLTASARAAAAEQSTVFVEKDEAGTPLALVVESKVQQTPYPTTPNKTADRAAER